MKKIMLLLIALFITISAAHADSNVVQALNSGVTVEQLLEDNVSESDLLAALMTGGMDLATAVETILNAGGDQGNTFVAALIVDSDFQMPVLANNGNPVGDLPAPGAGNDNNDGDLGDIDVALNDNDPQGDDRTGVSP